MVRPGCGRCCIAWGAAAGRLCCAGDVAWGVEPVMSRAEQEGLAYLFRLRMTANVKRALTKMMAERDWTTAGHGWQGKETTLRLVGWSRQRRVVLLRRKLDRPLVLVDRAQPEQPLLSFAEVGPDREVSEYAALVTSLDSEILTLGQLYRDRGDCENTFDELKNQWGWGGFTTHDLKRCRLLAGSVALIFNWWSLFVRLADLDHRPEAITSRPLLMQAIARQTQHAARVTMAAASQRTQPGRRHDLSFYPRRCSRKGRERREVTPGGPHQLLTSTRSDRLASIIPCKCAAAFSMSWCLYWPARLSALSTPQRWIFLKSP